MPDLQASASNLNQMSWEMFMRFTSQQDCQFRCVAVAIAREWLWLLLVLVAEAAMAQMLGHLMRQLSQSFSQQSKQRLVDALYC